MHITMYDNDIELLKSGARRAKTANGGEEEPMWRRSKLIRDFTRRGENYRFDL